MTQDNLFGAAFNTLLLLIPVLLFICSPPLPPQVSELVKLPAMAKPKVVLAITDLTLPLGRRVAAKAISAL